MTLIGASSGVFVATTENIIVVFDPRDRHVHFLEGTALAWLLGVEEPAPLSIVAAAASDATGVPLGIALAELTTAAQLLGELGLLNRCEVVAQPPPWQGSPLHGNGRPVGRTHPVLDTRLAFRSSDTSLLDDLDDLFGPGVAGVAPTIIIDAEPRPDGAVVVNAANEWVFPSRAACLGGIVSTVNEYASYSSSTIVIHSAAVRTPDGRVLLLPGVMNSGKSTLAAALVHAGCDYLGDESIGVRDQTLVAVGYPKPLTLDDPSRNLLGLAPVFGRSTAPRELRSDVIALWGDCGPISEILCCEYNPVRQPETVALDPLSALRVLLSNTSNLIRVGERGLQTLCDLARTVPVANVSRDDALSFAQRVIDNEHHTSPSRPGPGYVPPTCP